MGPWANFFVAEAGAAAALTRLLFVAVSINLARVLEFARLPTLAFQTLMSFVVVMMLALVGRVPGQSSAVFGIELGVVGVLASAVELTGFVRLFAVGRGYGGFMVRAFLNQAAPACFVVAGVLARHVRCSLSGLMRTLLLSLFTVVAVGCGGGEKETNVDKVDCGVIETGCVCGDGKQYVASPAPAACTSLIDCASICADHGGIEPLNPDGGCPANSDCDMSNL